MKAVGTSPMDSVPRNEKLAGRQGWFPAKIFSGGQTGVDRAALDWAIHHQIPHGGWCPKGRLATDGPLSACYLLQETESAGYRQRTKINVKDSDATLIFNVGDLDGGTLQTQRFAEQCRRPYLVLQLDLSDDEKAATAIVDWLKEGRFRILNVAGPREEKRAGIHARVFAVLNKCLAIAGGK